LIFFLSFFLPFFFRDVRIKMNKREKLLTIIACNTDSLLKKKALLHNLPFFAEKSDYIIIINSSEYRFSKDDMNRMVTDSKGSKMKFIHVPNDKYLCHGKWICALQNTDISNFENVILTNDSFIFRHSPSEFYNRIDTDTELVALLDSYEIKYHYPDFLRCYNKEGLQKVIQYYYTNKSKISDFQSVVDLYEVGSTDVFQSDKVKIAYKQECARPINIHFIDPFTFDYLTNKDYPVIKIKKVLFSLENPSHLPFNFSASLYQRMYSDLQGNILDENELKAHFLNVGVSEKRPYTPFLETINVDVYLHGMLREMQLLPPLMDLQI